MNPLLPHDAALAAVGAAPAPGDLFGELFAEHRDHVVVEVAGGEVRTCRLRQERGVGIRRVTPHDVRHLHVDHLDPDALPSLTRALRHDEPLRDLPRHSDVAEFDVAPSVRAGLEAEAEALRVSQEVMVRVVTGVQRVLIARADTGVTEESRPYAAVHVHAVARRGKQVRRSRRSVGATDIHAILARGLHLEIARVAGEAAERQVDAVAAPSGEFPVVLGPGSPAMLVHEACGHALEADLAGREGSAYGALLGRRVADPIVTLVDDPALPGDSPLYGVDDEGEPARPVTLVERGVVRSFLRDRRHGGSGHGRRLGYAYPPLPRMASTVIAAGEEPPEDIIAATDRGVYVQSIGGGDTDMGSGRFNLQVDEGFLIENGRIGAPIRGAVLSGRGPYVLAAIDRVGSDLHVLGHTYLCRKLDQFPLVVNVGQPTIRVSKLAVWGG